MPTQPKAPSQCLCVKRHAPGTVYFDRHHILPQGWGGKSTVANLVTVCQNCHRLVHEILEAAVREQHWPSSVFLAHFNRYAVSLARESIKRYGGIPPKHMLGTSDRK
jgi:5-methylcytosine-specific restriction endonuclease McrA